MAHALVYLNVSMYDAGEVPGIQNSITGQKDPSKLHPVSLPLFLHPTSQDIPLDIQHFLVLLQ
jgi:hypothetical protein